MNNKVAAWLACFVASILSLNTAISHTETMKTEELNAKQQNIVTIAAFTASGELPKLSEAFNEGLAAGRRRALKTLPAKNLVRRQRTRAGSNSEPKTRLGLSVHRPPGLISPSYLPSISS